MRAHQVWVDQVRDKDNVPQPVYSTVFSPDGTRLLAAVGTRILVYNSADGVLIDSLRGHKGTVFCLAYSPVGNRFASGGADKTVVIWTHEMEGVLKFTHNESIQALAYNPVTLQLASCSTQDFGLWCGEQKNVVKSKLSARATCCAWTHDGQYLAIGLYSGVVSVRQRSGDEKLTIQRPGGHPVWCLSWSPSYGDQYGILTVGDWGQKLSFYQLNGRQIGKDKNLGFDPCCLSYFCNGDFILVSGSNKELTVYSREGIRLISIASEDSWVWSAAGHPEQQNAVVGTNNGTISFYSVSISMVHGLYKDRYAYRENLTDVVVQHLVTDQVVKIKCRDMVKRVAIYKQRLAVVLAEQLIVYELVGDDPSSDMDYKVKERILRKFDCSLLVICSQHVVLCQEDRLQLVGFAGEQVRHWQLDSVVRYIKVIGGPSGKEGLLVGLKSGQVLKLFVNSPFPVQLLTHHSSVRCVDLNVDQNKLAVVDESNTCSIYQTASCELLSQDPDATSVAWNSHHPDLLCYSGMGWVYIKTGSFPCNKQKGQGFVVGFTGTRVYSLKLFSVQTIEVPLSSSMHQYLDKRDYKAAYQIATLGVTESDWRNLAQSSLAALDFEIARKSFIRVRDLHYLELLGSIEERISRGERNNSLFLGDINAYQKNFQEAAKLYKKSGHPGRAMDLFTDLRQFDFAKEFLAESDAEHVKQLIEKQADWCETINDPKTACDIYTAAGEYDRAIDLMAKHGWADKLAELGRKLDKDSFEAVLQKIAEVLKQMQQFVLAVEVLNKIGHTRSLIKLFVDSQQWEEALPLAEKHPELKDEVYLPYATWLAEHDRFDEAQEAFNKAGRQSEATQVLRQLTENAVEEKRFDDASYYLWLMSRSVLDRYSQESEEAQEQLAPQIAAEFQHSLRLSELYHAYHFIHTFTVQPFTSLMPETLFNMARYLTHAVVGIAAEGDSPGISKANIMYTLARQGKAVEAYKLSRYAFEELQGMVVPRRFQEIIDFGCLTIRCKPFHDREDLMPVCYRCNITNPLLNKQGNECINCKHPFVYSFVSFEVLPLVEFALEADITDAEATSLIKMESSSAETGSGSGSGQQREFPERDAQTLVLDEHDPGESRDLFMECLLAVDHTATEYSPLLVNREVLRSLTPPEIFIKHWPPPLRNQYFKSLMPDLPISLCPSCFQVFHSDDFDLQILQKGACPFCRAQIDSA